MNIFGHAVNYFQLRQLKEDIAVLEKMNCVDWILEIMPPSDYHPSELVRLENAFKTFVDARKEVVKTFIGLSSDLSEVEKKRKGVAIAFRTITTLGNEESYE